eukprot:6415099-Pyramimonas_sp.AAC.1
MLSAAAFQDDLTGLLGPFVLPDGGTVTAEDQAEIQRLTGCKASVRERSRQHPGKRLLTVHGPPEWLRYAYYLALTKVEANGEHGGRRSRPTASTASATLLRPPP